MMLAPTGRALGNAELPDRWVGSSNGGISTRASGLPPVRTTSASTTSEARGPTGLSASNAAAASESNPPTWCRGTPDGENRCPSASRAANSMTSPSASSRLATNSSASAEEASSQCASSIRQSTGACSAASARSVSVATATRNGFGPPAGAAANPNAPRKAKACGGGSASMRSWSGQSNWCSPANASSVSESTPTTRSTCMVSARWAAKESKAVFPMPASPVRTRTPLRCRKADTSRCSIVAISAARPCSTSKGYRRSHRRSNGFLNLAGSVGRAQSSRRSIRCLLPSSAPRSPAHHRRTSSIHTVGPHRVAVESSDGNISPAPGARVHIIGHQAPWADACNGGPLGVWRVRPRWYAAAILIPVAEKIIVDVAGLLLGQTTAPLLVSSLSIAALTVPLVVLIPGMLEELGWRGFAVQTAIDGGRSPALRVGVVAGGTGRRPGQGASGPVGGGGSGCRVRRAAASWPDARRLGPRFARPIRRGGVLVAGA